MKKQLLIFMTMLTIVSFGQTATWTGTKTFGSTLKFIGLPINNGNTRFMTLDVTGKPSTTAIPTQVQPDWNATSGLGTILNKPEIPVVVPQVQSDWNATSGLAAILNKPEIPVVIPQVQPDWNATSGLGQILNKPVNGWGLTGNSLTDPLVNFIGTSDDQNLIFKRNNIRCGYIGTQNTTFGNNAGLNLIDGTALINTAIGISSLRLGTNVRYNTAVGQNALYNLANFSEDNIGIGFNALVNLTLGNNNTVLGGSAGRDLISASGNIVIGSNSAIGLTYGINNIFVGTNCSAVRGASNYNVVIGNLNTDQGLKNNHVFIADGQNNKRLVIDNNGKTNLMAMLNVATVPIYADNTAAVAGGLVLGDVYRNSTGQLFIRF
jgi:hypothetical protein